MTLNHDSSVQVAVGSLLCRPALTVLLCNCMGDPVYTLYTTLNKLNGRFYIGVHKTRNPNDDYLGSGKFLMASIAKYGRKNFKKTVICYFPDAETAFLTEKDLVAIASRDPLCMNLKDGGSGGFDYIARHNLNANNLIKARATTRELKKDPAYNERMRPIILSNLSKARAVCRSPECKAASAARLAKYWAESGPLEWTLEMRNKASIARCGSNNPNFGKIWINNGLDKMRVVASEADTWLAKGWERGRVKRAIKVKIDRTRLHGTVGKYRCDLCRCDACIKSYREYYRRAMKARYSNEHHRYLTKSTGSVS